MRLRAERNHGLHVRTINKLYIQHFYTSLRGTSPVKGWPSDPGTSQRKMSAEIGHSTA